MGQAEGITRNCGHDFMGKMVLQLRFLLILNNTPATYTKGIGQTWAETGTKHWGLKLVRLMLTNDQSICAYGKENIQT